MTLLHCILTQGLSNLSNRFDRRLCVCMNLILPGETNVTELGRGKFVLWVFMLPIQARWARLPQTFRTPIYMSTQCNVEQIHFA